MDLPILKGADAVSSVDVVRFYHKVTQELCSALSESESIDEGVALYNPALADQDLANRLVDAFVPPGTTPDAAIAAVDAFYAGKGTACRAWVPNPSKDPAAAMSLVDALTRRGYQMRSRMVHHARRLVRPSRPEAAGLQILPARSAYRQSHDLARQRAEDPHAADVLMLYLDEPRYDAQIALRDGVAVATVGVLTVGDIGFLADLYVLPDARGKGIGRTMLGRAVDYCVRSTFRHVLAGTAVDDIVATRLLAEVGFAPVGEYREYVAGS